MFSNLNQYIIWPFKPYKSAPPLYCLVLLAAPVSQSEDLNAVAAASQERWFPGW